MQGLPLTIVQIILGLILIRLFSDFKARGLRSIPTPMTALAKYLLTETNVHPLPAS